MFWFTGDFKKLVQHNSLKNLELKSSIKITGKDIQNLIPRCPQLQRLVMHGCCPTVFYPIIKYSPPGLKIFGYNPLPGSPVPELQPTTPLGNEYQGLQILYVFNEEGSLPINDVLLLLYNNRTTLTTLHVGMSVPSPHTSVYDITCPDFKLENLVHLSFWGSSQIQDILFQKIQDLNALTTLNGENIYSLEPCFKNVKRLSSLISLNINHVDYPVKQDHTVQFFDMFSSRSKIGLPSLQEIALHNVPGVNDTILNVMGDIKTLQVVTLGGLRQISTAEINTFIQKLGCQLSRIRFVGMKTVTDDTIIGLCMSSNLATVDLESLEKVTRNSLQYLCDNAISNRLSEVRVKNCSAIGRDAIFRFTPIE
ncbi:hypothetical protein BDA99DRAFT_196481 [Phascolomyces articulosus]|uniref:Uncharacterized protein n=1 Tax=Phascolomyces articulosus TaxID=60185 RepID=A0AAD5PJ77_9FUNG|nr:hypothetical protein BDA99DRAFT_196481 [Phascolomyces articulosus]